MTSSVVGPRSAKALLKAKHAQKKGHGHSLVVCCWSDPLPLSESRWNHYIQEVCSANQWDALNSKTPTATLVNRMGPTLLHDNTWLHITQPALQKLNELGYEILPHPPYSLDLLTTDYHFFMHFNNFSQGNCFHNQQEAENPFQEFIKSQSRYFCATAINKLISHWQNCIDCNGSYFD